MCKDGQRLSPIEAEDLAFLAKQAFLQDVTASKVAYTSFRLACIPEEWCVLVIV